MLPQRKEAARANERAANLENETINARLELERIKYKQAPWILTEKQMIKLKELLERAPKGKIEIAYILSDGGRVSGLARCIESIFRNAGYSMAPEIGMISNPSNPKGLKVLFREEKDRERSQIYANIFKSVGIPCEWGQTNLANPPDPRFPDPVEIYVFSKP